MNKVSSLTLLAALSSAAFASAQAAPAVVGATVSVATAPVCRELGCRLLGSRIDASGPGNPLNVSTYVLAQGQWLEETRLHLPSKPGHGQTVRLRYDRGQSAYGAVNAAKLASAGARGGPSPPRRYAVAGTPARPLPTRPASSRSAASTTRW